ncbi:MAG: hypothetical protein EOP51_21960 [Sphingobacteriales bacterium]|nr:MAG: hypothetical protein EOP51_21960 [Sphingobacteriales bacterium]
MKLLYLLLACFLLLTACSKDDDTNSPDTLPPATQEGKNTFGCKVNGRNWVPDSDDWMASVLYSHYISQDTTVGPKGQLHVGASNGILHQGVRFTIPVLPPILGNYTLNQSHYLLGGGGGYSSNISPNSSNDYFTDTLHTGTVTLTKFDTINHIVSGTFYFQAKLQGGTETVNVTDGRFDISYYPF